MIDFTMTATSRPELLFRTLKSFSLNIDINMKECNFYINIDNVDNDLKKCEFMVKIANKFFNKVVYNISDNPNYTNAVNWCWLNAQSDIIFHLEDDWVLLTKLKVGDLCKKFECENLRQLAFRAYGDGYFKHCTSPSLIHKRLYKVVAGKLDHEINPEIQMRGLKFGILLPNSELENDNYIEVYPKSQEIIIKDIGREWLSHTDFKKPELKKDFTKWVKK